MGGDPGGATGMFNVQQTGSPAGAAKGLLCGTLVKAMELHGEGLILTHHGERLPVPGTMSSEASRS